MSRDRTAAAASQLRRLSCLRRWTRRLDSVFRVPGTGIRFGWDPILGLVPGLGEIATPLFSVLLLGQAFSVKVPAIVQIRMLANVAFDMGAGLVPGLGDVLDVAWKANTRNLALLERYIDGGARPGIVDWLVSGVVIAVAGALAVTPIVAIAWVIFEFGLV